MAFKTARNYRPAEIQSLVAVSGAVDPTVDSGPVRDRQLKKLIVLPVQIRLSFATRADYKVEAFGY